MIKKCLDSQLAGLAPWIVFSLLAGPQRLEESVLLALLTAVILFVLNLLEGETFKALALSDIIFFAGLAIVVALAGEDELAWLEVWANEISNVAFVVIAAGSILLRKPFTLPYARDKVDPSQWNEPEFIHTNYVIAWVWTGAFTVAAISGAYGDGVLNDPDNLWTGWIIQTLALIWAARFTEWYTDRQQALGRRDAGIPAPPPPSVMELVKSFSGYTSMLNVRNVREGRSRQGDEA
ncbi:MAG TPA: hypothetical protein VM121_03325 [Acidimicrobiales bacterium]|nr:hypothetical protein [Acidimicrobiales bacterium]